MSKLMVAAAKAKAKIKGAIPAGKPELVAKWEETTTFKMVSGLFVMVNAGIIYKGFYSYDKLTDTEKISLWITSTQTSVDGITSIVDAIKSGYKAYKSIGAKIADLIKPNVVSPIAQAVATTNVAKFATLIKMTKYLKIVTGVLLVASMLVSGYELVTAISNKQWGEAALSLTELSLTFALFVLTFFVSTSWSGPACLVLTFVLIDIVIAVAKMF
ncbi:hypothetical protein PPL_12349 [Heterostelium album PN500]|uniref:Uncharacterized protein n=1 Tax=Heterostelium pallidum (strain ATCC 26659 / Pp 5 / PN500) TaxID=670386 RepID=D3BMD6_HETP5|nr:hypothetical protein PPL_12349 [Heterostelium album PN500]EFA77737.1 hypothetical protein PPL_12349 [Heterostelium album PN500]|eukprot:XP_020429865.1 hypothetical protein PPL_12349 [Heterostelium album PN500]